MSKKDNQSQQTIQSDTSRTNLSENQCRSCQSRISRSGGKGIFSISCHTIKPRRNDIS